MPETLLPTETETLFSVLGAIAPLGLSLRDDLTRLLQRHELPRKHLLLRQGQIAKRIYFIARGFARAYYLDPDGKENTLWFMGAGDVMISVYSFFTQQPGCEIIELLEDCVLLSITSEELNDVYADHPAFNYHGRKLTEYYYMKAEERAMILHCRKPLDRLVKLLETFPGIFQQVSVAQVATYLGIEPETLSRLRREYAQMIKIKK